MKSAQNSLELLLFQSQTFSKIAQQLLPAMIWSKFVTFGTNNFKFWRITWIFPFRPNYWKCIVVWKRISSDVFRAFIHSHATLSAVQIRWESFDVSLGLLLLVHFFNSLASVRRSAVVFYSCRVENFQPYSLSIRDFEEDSFTISVMALMTRWWRRRTLSHSSRQHWVSKLNGPDSF